MLDSILESLKVVTLPTKTDFRSVTRREVALFEGVLGWGEFSPFLEYAPEECVPWLVSGIESAFVPSLQPQLEYVRINATLPAINGADKIEEVLSWFPGCDTIKIKVGSNLQEDLVRVAHVRSLRPSAKIRIDVNGAWEVESAITALRSIYENAGELEYVEQPCGSLEELRELKKRIGIPLVIAGDEVIRKATDPLSLDVQGAVDVIMLKVAPLGGIRRSLKIAAHHGLPSVVSSALDSAVGISRGLMLAGSFDSQTYAAGLGTGSLLSADVSHLPIVNGQMKVEEASPSKEALFEFDAGSERCDFWRARISQTWRAGAREWAEREGWVT